MLGPIHQARHDVCVGCENWEDGRCQDALLDKNTFGDDAERISLAPWKYRQECELWPPVTQ